MEYLALLLPACLCWRPRHLLAVTITAALIIAAAGSRGGTASLVYLIPVLAVTFVLSYRLGNAGGWRTIAGPALLAATAEVINPGFNPFLLMVTFGPWAAGQFVRSRRRLAAELAEAGKLLEAERSRYADEAVRYERVHLARELHDTVAHWLTAVVIQARAGQVRSLTQQESMAATFADIVTAAGRADEEITRAATLLGHDGTAPDSLLELADHLADAVRAAGTDVTFRGAGHHVLSPAVTADALRIIQEGLTNSMKHAPGAPVSVTLEVTATGLNIDIVNEPARSAPLELDGGAGGAGLPGMTERVKAHGGQLSAGPVPGGGWRVAASLPSGTHPRLVTVPARRPSSALLVRRQIACFGAKCLLGPIRVRVCWRPWYMRWSMKDPQTARNKSSVRVTGREPEARGANDTPDHPPQTREYPSSSRLARIRPHATRHRRSADQPLRRSAAA